MFWEGHWCWMDKQHTIVGVLPPMTSTLTGFDTYPIFTFRSLSEATRRSASLGRVPTGITRAAAAERLKSACMELDKVYPDGNHKWANDIAVMPLVGAAV